MKITLKETELFDLRSILVRVSPDKASAKAEDRFKGVTLKRHILKEINEKNKEFVEKVEKADEITQKVIEDLGTFKKEIGDVDKELSEKEQQAQAEEKMKLIREEEQKATEKIQEEHEALGIKSQHYPHWKITRFVYVKDEDDKDIEIELLDEKDKNQVDFIKDIIERVALDIWPLEDPVVRLGEIFGV